MRILVATLIFSAAACGGPKHKQESSIVQEGDTPATCCCKTIPDTAEKEIIPVYTMEGRMECSTKNGVCVHDVQCNGSTQAKQSSEPTGTGVPPPPAMAPEPTRP